MSRHRSVTRWAYRHPAATVQLVVLAVAVTVVPAQVKPWAAATLLAARAFWAVRAHDRPLPSRRMVRPPIPPLLRAAVLARDGHACLACGSRQELQMDHVWPFSRGGETTYANLQTLCGPCNRAKGARVPSRRAA